MTSYPWNKSIIHLEDEKSHYFSIVFSWDLWEFCKKIQPELDGKNIIIGGPAVYVNKSWVPEWVNIGFSLGFEYLKYHNPNATRTTKGCIRKCSFCAVPVLEPDYYELKEWEVKPIIIDNNFLASSKKHFDSVIDKLKLIKECDFNQGLDARLLSDYHVSRFSELKNLKIRLAFDSVKNESDFIKSAELLKKYRIPKRNVSCYVLIGFRDTPEDALHRLELIKKYGFYTNPMRYQPLDAKEKNSYIGKDWTNKQLIDYSRYWSNYRYFGKIPFNEYCNKIYKGS